MKKNFVFWAVLGFINLSLGAWKLLQDKLPPGQHIQNSHTDTLSLTDAVIWSAMPEDNYSKHPQILSNAWSHNGKAVFMRTLFDVDLSLLPEGAQIDKATLSLHHHVANKNPGHNGNNQSTISRIVEPWEEHKVNWNNQPATTNLHQVILPNSHAGDEDYLDIDITQLLRDAHSKPTESHGFLLQLQNETHYRSMVFASSDVAVDSLRPMLILTYTTRQ